MKKLFPILASLVFLISCNEVKPPNPVGPLPSERQLAWHEMEYYMFAHFTVNTFTDREWGLGDEAETVFDPTALDCRQWARVAKEAGMKGIIITAKHHDGFCLWPSQYTSHSVKKSKWKDGEGDVVGDLSKACKEYGLKLGVYLSPWDRNSAVYASPEYITYYRNQLRELLTKYGDIFEVWFDGANRGDGYYGGAREIRKIDNKTYYDWKNTHKIVRELQPDAVMFSDAGPDIRWVGNESGLGSPTNWSLLKRDEMYPGGDFSSILGAGHSDGNYWVPAEVDVSIRPGWFYHAKQDTMVKSPGKLMELYYASVGRNCNLLLNVPPDRRGLLNENDVKSLMGFKELRDKEFASELTKGKRAEASAVRGKQFNPSNTIDDDPETYWSTPDKVRSASVTINLGEATDVNCVLIQEYIKLGQRVQKYSVQALKGKEWKTVVEGTTIGYKVIRKFPVVKASQIRISIEESKASPLISNIKLYRAPGE